MKLKARVDENQPDIVAALRGIGATVSHTHQLGKGFPDICVGFRGMNFLFEIKPEDGELTPDETRWHLEWSGQVQIVRSPEEAIELITGSHERHVREIYAAFKAALVGRQRSSDD